MFSAIRRLRKSSITKAKKKLDISTSFWNLKPVSAVISLMFFPHQMWEKEE
jgi:hypothetical protein